MKMVKALGHIVSGSLSEGFVMRINPLINLQELKAGRFVSIVTPDGQFFSLITDLKLEVTNPDIMLFPPGENEKILHRFLRTRDIYAVAMLRPLLLLSDHKQPMPVKTIPAHFAPVSEVSPEDVVHVFGDERHESKRFFNIGSPLDMDVAVCVNLEKLTERSTGVFGKTGTGKTFLTRLILAGLIQRNKAAVVIFDMHSEYGLQSHGEASNQSFVKGLKTLFPESIALFSLDPQSTLRRGGSPDVNVVLTYQSISVEDILSLQEELNLHPTALEAAHLIAAKYKRDWLAVLLQQGDCLKDFALEIGAHPESVAALYRKLKKIEQLPFFAREASGYGQPVGDDVFKTMLDYIDKGTSIIIEFGNHTSTFCYLLIANIITRRLRSLYVKKTEKFLGSRRPQDEPKKLLIVIEEAHKFLNPQAARQTIFGTIAREMRKYYVSLLIVDQRPSGIDAEILSQLGTKMMAQLSDERDIQAVLTGVYNATQLRSVLSSLESKKQVLVLGHAVAMPIVIESRLYDSKFYASLVPQIPSDMSVY